MGNTKRLAMVATGAAILAGVAAAVTSCRSGVDAQAPPFHLLEATIADVQRAIQTGQITCQGLVQAYINRTKAYNGVSNALVTPDGGTIPAVPGVVRAGSPLKFPTATVKASTVLPDLDQYAGPPIEFGRMEPTASDPSVQQQYGMTVGISNAGQVNALGTINIRGERSVTCKGEFDKAPGKGALPSGAPPVCQQFREQPDAIERAVQLDAQYGRNPDLSALPMYCIPFSFKDPFDTKDMRSTGGADAGYDIDFPARDHVLVDQLRKKGAIIYAKSVLTEYNGRAGNPGGKNKPNKVLVSTEGFQRSTWGGNPSNPYDTTRAASLGSSSGSGVAVSTNLVMCGLCEESRASCRGPANHNSDALILPHKALIGFDGGAIGSDIFVDRTGIHCRTVTDAAKVLDALKDPVNGYYDPRDVFTTVPRASALEKPYITTATTPGTSGALKGMRIGIIRESMLIFPGVKADEPVVTAAAREIKTVLGEKLGVTLVESVDPLWPDDPEIPNMNPTYTQALAQLVPVFFPEILFRLTPDGQPLFPEFAATIKPTKFAPGRIFGSGKMDPIDYLVSLAEGRVPIPANLNIRTVQQQAEAMMFRFHFRQYAMRRAADWEMRGFKEGLVDFPTLNARSKFWGDDQRAAFKNWEEISDPRNPLGERQGIDERIRLHELLRRVEMKVILENHLDVVVRLHSSLAPHRIALGAEPAPPGNTRGESAFGPNAGLTEVLVPAGYVRTLYDPLLKLSADKTHYVATSSNAATTIPAPGLRFSLVFRSDPGREDLILKVASAYQAASKRRVPPPAFKALPNEP
jgi:Asp-tRNA(Asn)/Glu-tRNA(Gln) amidotransferase A subunit family amidase